MITSREKYIIKSIWMSPFTDISDKVIAIVFVGH